MGDVKIYKREEKSVIPPYHEIKTTPVGKRDEQEKPHGYFTTLSLTDDLYNSRELHKLNEHEFIDYMEDNMGLDVKGYWEEKNANHMEYHFVRAVDYTVTACFVTVPILMSKLSVDEYLAVKLIAAMQKYGIIGEAGYKGICEAKISLEEWENIKNRENDERQK